MRISILIGFFSLWILSIIAPAMITFLDSGEQSVVVLCHNEEEQQEAGEKDKLEEKILQERFYKVVFSDQWENTAPIDWYWHINSGHVQEIPLPPPEHHS